MTSLHPLRDPDAVVVRSAVLREGARVRALESKSVLQRLFFMGLLSTSPLEVTSRLRSGDVHDALSVIGSLGAGVDIDGDRILITPAVIDGKQEGRFPESLCRCEASGTAFRFGVAAAAALGRSVRFTCGNRLSQRPVAELLSVLARGGVDVAHGNGTKGKDGLSFSLGGRLRAGLHHITGSVSSQYVSAMLTALASLEGESRLLVEAPVLSRPYIDMTAVMLERFGTPVEVEIDAGEEHPLLLRVRGMGGLASPGTASAPGDWSDAAFWLAACAVSPSGTRITVEGLEADALQGDRAVVGLLRRFGALVLETPGAVTLESAPLTGIDFDASETPDLVPALAVVAGAALGLTRIHGVDALRHKESDRIASVRAMLASLGVVTRETHVGVDANGHPSGTVLEIEGLGGRFRGASPARIPTEGDHRIVMAAAAAAFNADRPVVVTGASAAAKSHPGFFKDLSAVLTTPIASLHYLV